MQLSLYYYGLTAIQPMADAIREGLKVYEVCLCDST